jgi:hypothetical protein
LILLQGFQEFEDNEFRAQKQALSEVDFPFVRRLIFPHRGT